MNRKTWRLLLLALFFAAPSLVMAQAFPPDGAGGVGMGGAAAAPITGVDGCVTPAFAFTNDPDSGFCRDDGTGPYGLAGVAVQTSDATDLEYAGLFASEAGGDPFFFQLVAFDDGGNNGASIFGQSIGTTTPITQIVLNAADFTGGVTGSADFTLSAPDAGVPVGTITITGDGGPVSTTTFGDDVTTFSDPIEGAAGSITNAGFGFSVQPDAGMWITGAAGTVLIQNKDVTPDGLGRARMSIGEEFWNASATHDTVDTRVASIQGSSEASAEMRFRINVTEDTSNEIEVYADPDEISGRVEDTGANVATFNYNETNITMTHTDATATNTLTIDDTVISAAVDDGTDSCTSTATPFGLLLCTNTFAALGTPADGTLTYCSDCTKATPCAAVGGGALAKRIAGAWDCD